ncbi:phenylacetate-CoA oxygenase subunit PaaJ [Gordonia desulfuricans]|uniref:Phenylacetate-CoA oxygenase subunit PaaJ n=1 Tax=Gordonia desulfuricans TaxID=89051 RepID=A0A7K3LJN7_9ACTN|nr:1,2-phenylacetyl-CoA epoxidase subunit PaaD [Gordonia desulfuricans]NDK88281.1 phenylacetate-CoA oxygenase subunit PaaJ [Gordonia desulfuricans]
MDCATTIAPREIVGSVLDPEMPMVTLDDLGIIRAVDVDADGSGVQVTITPTYSGCPAMATIRDDITAALNRAGHLRVQIHTALHPAWSTDWISEAGRRKLRQAGYSAPGAAPRRAPGPVPLTLTVRTRPVHCPQCDSDRTELISEFGATLCKAHYRCLACGEPFDHMKEI